MAKKDYLQQKYEEINKLKNQLLNDTKGQSESIFKAMSKIFDDIERYLKKHKIRQPKTNKVIVTPDKIFTLEELAKYDGKNGNKAYVAVDGVVYDVSKSLLWQGGSHYGLKAGQDLSKFFYQCHSKEKNVLKNAVVVGSLEQPKV